MKLLVAAILCLALFPPSGRAQSKTEPPVPVRTVQPDYPDQMRRDGVSGIVTIKCSIDMQGNVTEAQVEKSTNAAFEPAAVAAVKKWKFKPAKQDGNAVPITVTIPIKFVVEA